MLYHCVCPPNRNFNLDYFKKNNILYLYLVISPIMSIIIIIIEISQKFRIGTYAYGNGVFEIGEMVKIRKNYKQCY